MLKRGQYDWAQAERLCVGDGGDTGVDADTDSEDDDDEDISVAVYDDNGDYEYFVKTNVHQQLGWDSVTTHCSCYCWRMVCPRWW